MKNTTHIVFNDKKLDNVRFFKVIRLPAVRKHLTANFHADEAIFRSVDESSLLRLDPNENLKVDEQDSINLNSNLSSTKMIIKTPKKSYVDSSHEINRNRRDFQSVFNDQDNDLDNFKLPNLDSVTVNRNPSSDNEISSKKYDDDSIGEGTIVRFNQRPENYLKVSFGNDFSNLTKDDKIKKNAEKTIIEQPNDGGFLLKHWNTKCKDKNNNVIIQNFIKSPKTNSPPENSGATSLPPIGDSFMDIETSSGSHGNGVSVSFELTDVIQIGNKIFDHNRFSFSTKNSAKSMGRLKIQLLFADNTWSTRYNIPKND